ncbi:cell division protein [Rhizobium leguminosarum bv. trifolii]|uniref:Cell division protein n=1 Tax=Rhizobium leguminosarum bv. trifolii TaxID=386 RepID=A0A3E1BY36_RHILT|nr:AAA family ATPase [Rhizobium leguminosarum]RFB98022.1 cell division protein [Rhizobium leguminosarum bv. trifolii]RFB99975.1 cell division protein [Rhizobium leguminosarum bv. trifolii]
MAYKSRPDYERVLARLHIDRIVAGLGLAPRGVHLVIVPPTSDAGVWEDEGFLALRDLASARQLDVHDLVDDTANEVLISVSKLKPGCGIDVGLSASNAAAFLIFAAASDANHPTVALADGIIEAEFSVELVVEAAARFERAISHAEAKTLIGMPWRRRRLALLSPRPIEETRRLHMEVSEAEAEAQAKEAEAKNKASPRNVPDVRPLEELFGYGAAKDWGMELKKDIADWSAGCIAWTDVDNAVLLSGPPGCGKTTFASALAKSLDAHFVIGGYAAWISNGEGHQGDLIKAMRASFNEARACAPSVILIDEADAFVARGSIGHGRSDEWMRGVVNALLECTDGALEREGVIVIGAANNVTGIDQALRRSGRLDRHIELGLPDAGDRVSILEQHLGTELPLLSVVRDRSAGMSGADLERAAREARRLARRHGVTVNIKHVLKCLPKRERRTKDEIHALAVHEAAHAVVAAALGFKVLEVVISKDRTEDGIAGVAIIKHREGHHDAGWFVDRIAQLLAGVAAERMVFGGHAEGCVADLAEASNTAAYMLSSLGMGNTLVSDGHRDAISLVQARSFDPPLRRRIDDILQDQLSRAQAILEQNWCALDEVAQLLRLRGRLDGSEVHEAFDAYRPQPQQLSLAI